MTTMVEKPETSQPALLTRRAVAALVGLSPRTISRLRQRGKFPAPVQVPGLHGSRFKRSEVLGWMSALTKTPA